MTSDEGIEFANPPVTNNTSGEERAVGIEFEFSGVGMEATAGLIVSLFGGEIREESSYRYTITNTSLGDFKLELDASLFLNKEYEAKLKKIGIDVSKMEKRKELEELLRDMASSVVPFEIVSPPIKLSGLTEVNRLVHELREQKAEGTRSSFFNAFGLHLNPELPSDKAEDLLRYMKAFVIMEAWIRDESDIDWSRRLTPYIDEYPDKYKKPLFGENYTPSLKELITDYIKLGNDRNRSLDMLPAFTYLDKDLTKSLLEDDLTTARPTFHYRLPNCEISNEEWSLSTEWNRWVYVERMAESDQLDTYARQYHKLMLDPMVSKKKKWIKLVDRWVNNEA